MTVNPFQDIKVCAFDAYGTLFDVHSAAAQAGDVLGEKRDAVSQLWRQKQLEYTWLRSIMKRHADFWQVTGEALDFALKTQGIDDEAIHDRLMKLYLTLHAYPDVKPMMAQLHRAGLKTAILSNGEPKMLASAVESAGLREDLDEVLSIEEVGVYKPDASVYQMTCERFGVEPAQICFVSTNSWDARAAADFGYKVAWMNRFGVEADRLPGAFSAVMTGLDELPGLLGLTA